MMRLTVFILFVFLSTLLSAFNPVLAVLSQSTGQIKGTPPTATGELKIMFPDGLTEVTNNSVVALTQSPNQFLVSTSGMILQDLDQDSGLSTTINSASISWVWEVDGLPLTVEQLASSFNTNFSGKTLNVAATAPVTISSLTGDPAMGTQSFNSRTYTVIVPSTPVIEVNGGAFSLSSGFPQTGFIGATFQIRMNGTDTTANSAYYFVSDQSWVTVDATGTVSFVGEPTSANKAVTISITPKAGVSLAQIYTFSLVEWFINNNDNILLPVDADSWCLAQPGGYSTSGYTSITNATTYGSLGTRGTVGKLWPEWGMLGSFSTWSNGVYWARESTGVFRYEVNLGNGSLAYSFPGGTYNNVICSKFL